MSKGPVIEWGTWGWVNPDGLLACGAKDDNAKFPDPVHFGGCKGCKRVIETILLLRAPRPSERTAVQQTEFEWAPKRRSMKGA